MKLAVVVGDLSSNSTDEQYPTVTLCESCIKEDRALKELSKIVNLVGIAGPDDGPCDWCESDFDDE